VKAQFWLFAKKVFAKILILILWAHFSLELRRFLSPCGRRRGGEVSPFFRSVASEIGWLAAAPLRRLVGLSLRLNSIIPCQEKNLPLFFRFSLLFTTIYGQRLLFTTPPAG
jgi:hypothetical protein